MKELVTYSGRQFEAKHFFRANQWVTRCTQPSGYYSGTKYGSSYLIDDVNNHSGVAYVVDDNIVNHQRIKIAGSWYNANNFKDRDGANKTVTTFLAIESDRPTFVREFKETTKDGAKVREYIGDWAEFKNMSAAKTYTSEQITASIRAKNDYRKFAIFQEKHVSQAKQPEIEFV